jgi:hypothetical protein
VIQSSEKVMQNKKRLSKHLEKFEETYLKKFKKLIHEKIYDNSNLLRKLIIYPEDSIRTLKESFPCKDNKQENLPLNYFEDIIAPTERQFNNLRRNLRSERNRIIPDMAKRVQEHFKWISEKVMSNRIIWTGIKNYLLSMNVLNSNEFTSDDYELFLKLIYDQDSAESNEGK